MFLGALNTTEARDPCMDLVGELYRYFRDEREKHKREPGVYWVTDLVSCSQKEKFSRTYPELELAQLFRPALVQGALVHAGLEAVLKEILEERGAEVEVEPEAILELDLGEHLPDATGRVTVKGRADLVVKAPTGERVGVEIKTARADLSLPHEHHVDQVRIYNTMFGLEGSIIVYVTPDRVTQYEVRDRMSLADMARRVVEARAPRYPWECAYCPFAVLCPYKVVR
ncbi:MAG: CRISPR-associated protein Cas4 [Thermoprotei archaeon]|nr:MAG: CRISPR-associated protein Cas4 [Thermoprotei archaeon]